MMAADKVSLTHKISFLLTIEPHLKLFFTRAMMAREEMLAVVAQMTRLGRTLTKIALTDLIF